MNSQTKGHGYFRKSKAYGLVCGITLAGAFAFSSGNVSAEEVTAPATSPQTVVTTLTKPTNNQSQPVTSQVLDTAVETAKEAGVTVNTTPIVSHTDVPSAQADLSNQTQAVKDTTAKAEANTQAIKDATAKNAQIDAQNKAEAERVAQENKAGQLAVDQQNAEAQAKADATNAQLKADYEAKLAEIKTVEDYNKAVAERNALAKAQADATNAQLKADYQVKLDAYNKALADRANLVANDVSFEGYGKSEILTGYGQKTTDVVTVDKNGNFVIREPQSDTDGTFGNTKVTGKFIYTVTYDEATNKAIIKITGISLNTWQLDLTRQTTAVNRNISASYKDLAGNVLYTRNFDGLSSIGVQTINKSFALDKEIILSDGETSAEVMFLKTEPKWVISAPSTLFAKLTYDTADIPSKPVPPTLVTVTPEAEKPVPNTPPTPNYVTPVLVTFTPQTPTVKPHVSVPEKLVVTVSVHPVMVPVANPSKDVVDKTGKSINGYKVKSETVVTHTPETPKPVDPKKGVPTTPAKGLPQTGEASVAPFSAIGAIILSALGLLGFKKRKEN
ncbi:hypothetical protein DIX60_01790 [Streptococcus iniae]|nr:putative cross-wall-targeting lipoprotein signal domain-containing proteiin [Streptococcus iniae]RLV28402.1 hypothetical protein DIX60_01790 [Streptococcus iniae]